MEEEKEEEEEMRKKVRKIRSRLSGKEKVDDRALSKLIEG